ncbi:MAG: sugar transferase, partial [Desulfobacteraceae bacterium]
IIQFYKIFELLVMLICFALATWITYFDDAAMFPFEEFLAMRIKVWNFVLLIGLAFGWQFISSAFGLYQSSRLSTSLSRENLDFLKANSIFTTLLCLSSWLFDILLITPLFLAIFSLTTSVTCTLGRYVLRCIHEAMYQRDRNLRFLLIVGTNDRARKFAKKIQAKPELGYRFIGFVDEKWKGNGDLDKYDWKLVSNFDNFTKFINRNVVDEVVIALPLQSFYRQAAQIFSSCEEQGILVRNLSDLFKLKIARSKPDHFDGLPIVSHYCGCIFGWKAASKRSIDIAISALLLVILIPVFIIIAISIKISSRGSVLFVQDRIGLNKRVFRLYKFRTMVENAEQKQDLLESLNEMSGPAFKIKNDPRIHKIGRFLRKTSLDELPQLFNVLKGDMSLVGPRPLPVRDYNGFEIDWHRRRFSVLPGLTCLWQVNGRNNIPFDKWMELDLEYIDKWTLMLDFRILMKTIPTILRGSGAS